ncbi:Structure-specific endonuclease subunit SLX1 [Venustampulla echinocandica]|uniref:Structure-specific endonuclease subunit SLX1 n=1 Tax=Venustampulla echinocandica TaxID=2656787 RepID=A0A370TT99_9HELO|nr:Structure-specific endonuclease subunit SLX1 [Venustampulla echinocandica]RDL38761.1 Structure-specific endonuclease subunit SLX1 [Venustampulla echinocandica]
MTVSGFSANFSPSNQIKLHHYQHQQQHQIAQRPHPKTPRISISMSFDRPIPAFYCCYLLRSIARKSSVYVGSTTNPVRRLRQHNGLVKGGAARTARAKLRPWEMTCIVSGFPSQIAALQFEWAWQNSHITQHISPEDRIQHATQKKRSGQPKRPRQSSTSLLSNLHLLLRSQSFCRWPLEIRFFSEDVYHAWLKWTQMTTESIRGSIRVLQDFQTPNPLLGDENTGNLIPALPIDYAGQKSHVEKGKDIFDFEREGTCAVCHNELEHHSGIYTVCPSPGCESVTHMTCLSNHFLKEEDDDLVPIKGHCPSCMAELRWADVVKEASLRIRGQKEVQILLKTKRAKKLKDRTSSQAIMESSDFAEDADDEELDLHIEDQMGELQDSVSQNDWHVIGDSDDSATESVNSNSWQPKNDMSCQTARSRALDAVIEDSDWDDIEILD